jgi:hypothetical protein
MIIRTVKTSIKRAPVANDGECGGRVTRGETKTRAEDVAVAVISYKI